MSTRRKPAHRGNEVQGTHGVNASRGGPAQGIHDSQSSNGGPVAWPWPGTADLRAAAQNLDDAVRARISIGNRVGHPGNVVDADLAKVMLAAAQDHEDAARRLLTDVYEVCVPQNVRDWFKSVPGLASGELAARIVGITGNPRAAIPYRWEDGASEPVPDGPPRYRPLHSFWQWAGAGNSRQLPYSDLLGRPVTRADKLAAGKRNQLRPLLYVWSSGLLRSASPVTKEGSAKLGKPVSEAAAASKYWRLFEEARADVQGKLHDHECRNRKRAPWSNGCGTVAHPEWGAPGSPWRPKHVLMHAHRLAQKELLRDFWLVAGGQEPRA